ncbi:putative quinol monooxygenase [Pontibacter chitinilyticus]|uniref:putative quinol monooxygenase n=1 Tax=Pontibacter chitinilyticus TaxID=2674989 RepID=UPI003D297BCE
MTTTTKGLLVRLEAKHGKDDEVEDFLSSALPLVRQEAGTKAWFAIRFGRSEYGIVDFFPDEASRDAHLNGAVASALLQKADELFETSPDIQKIEVLASKLPSQPPAEPDTKGLLLTFKAKEGHEQEVVQFLKDAQPLAMAEEETIAWFAIHLPNDEYGIFDVFPDNGARLKHLTGRIPQELTKHALSLLGSFPDMDLLKVTAENFNP